MPVKNRNRPPSSVTKQIAPEPDTPPPYGEGNYPTGPDAGGFPKSDVGQTFSTMLGAPIESPYSPSLSRINRPGESVEQPVENPEPAYGRGNYPTGADTGGQFPGAGTSGMPPVHPRVAKLGHFLSLLAEHGVIPPMEDIARFAGMGLGANRQQGNDLAKRALGFGGGGDNTTPSPDLAQGVGGLGGLPQDQLAQGTPGLGGLPQDNLARGATQPQPPQVGRRFDQMESSGADVNEPEPAAPLEVLPPSAPVPTRRLAGTHTLNYPGQDNPPTEIYTDSPVPKPRTNFFVPQAAGPGAVPAHHTDAGLFPGPGGGGSVRERIGREGVQGVVSRNLGVNLANLTRMGLEKGAANESLARDYYDRSQQSNLLGQSLLHQAQGLKNIEAQHDFDSQRTFEHFLATPEGQRAFAVFDKFGLGVPRTREQLDHMIKMLPALEQYTIQNPPMPAAAGKPATPAAQPGQAGALKVAAAHAVPGAMTGVGLQLASRIPNPLVKGLAMGGTVLGGMLANKPIQSGVNSALGVSPEAEAAHPMAAGLGDIGGYFAGFKGAKKIPGKGPATPSTSAASTANPTTVAEPGANPIGNRMRGMMQPGDNPFVKVGTQTGNVQSPTPAPTILPQSATPPATQPAAPPASLPPAPPSMLPANPRAMDIREMLQRKSAGPANVPLRLTPGGFELAQRLVAMGHPPETVFSMTLSQAQQLLGAAAR